MCPYTLTEAAGRKAPAMKTPEKEAAMHGFTRPVPVRAFAVALPLLLAACGDGTPAELPPPAPRWIAVVPDSLHLTYLGERVRVQARIQRDPKLYGGREVKWSSTDTSVITVNEEGEVTALTNGEAGLAAELIGMHDTAYVEVRQLGARMEVLGGGQQGGAGLPLIERVGVRVTDAGGTLVRWYLPVDFDASVDGGRVSRRRGSVFRDGEAWTEWTLGPGAGPQTLLATAWRGTTSAEIHAVAVEADSVVAELSVHAGDGQGAPPGTALEEPVSVAAVDTLGRRVPNAAVRFEPAAGHGSVEPAETVTDSAGLASTIWTMGEAPGRQTMVVSAARGARVEVTAMSQSDEGVCPRTPAVAEAIVSRTDAATCAEVTDAHLAGIGFLNIHTRGIRKLRSGDFAGLSALRRLYLPGNELEELSAATFEGLSRLRYLDLANNRLTALPPEVFAGLPELEDLGLESNRLSRLPPATFAGNRKLGSLRLNDNELTELPPGIFQGLADLRELRLEENRLAKLRPAVFADLTNLESLNLHRNGLTQLPAGVFDGLAKLTTLDMSVNGLTELPAGAFAGAPNLESLDVSYNGLTELPPRVFAGKRRLEVVSARGNPGSPFPVEVAFARVDAGPLAPGPARVVMRVPAGAPFPFRMPVSVQRGSASAVWLEVGPGDTVSVPLMVRRPAGSTETVHLSFGQPPGPSVFFKGLQVVGGEQIALFAEPDNRSPVLAEPMLRYWLQAAGEAEPLTLGPYFTDPDGDSLTYRVESSDGRVAGGSVAGGVLWMEPRGEGEAVLKVTATDPAGLAATQPLAIEVAPAPDPNRFNIDLVFGPGFSDRHREVVREAADRWEEVVVGDLPDVPLDGYLKPCGYDLGTRMAGVIDDLVIHVKRGTDRTYVGTCGKREGTGLNFLSGNTFWPGAFAPGFEDWDLFHYVALHEIGHSLGIGTGSPWSSMLQTHPHTTPPDYYFPGPLAIAAFDAAGGRDYKGHRVPVSNSGASGDKIHWRYVVFGPEIMAGIAPVISAITVQALADLGHVVDVSKADPFALPAASGAADADRDDRVPRPGLEPIDEIRQYPVIVVDSTGKVVRVIRN